MLGTVTGVGGPPCVEDHGGDRRWPAGAGAPVAGRGGLGAVGAGHAQPGPELVAGPPAAPGRPARPRPARRRRRRPGAGGGERGHGRGGAGQPPAPPPGGMVAAGPGPVADRERGGLGVRRLWAAGPSRRPAGRPLRGPVPSRHRRHGPGLPRLRPAAHAHRVAALAALALVGQGHRGLGGALLVTYQLAFAVTNLAVVVGAASLVVRFRRARGIERQQLRWVALAAALAAPGSVVLLAAAAMGASPDLLGWVAGSSFAILPLAIGAAVLRYRLYDLDRIVSRTLAYGLLTVLLGGGYAGLVLGLGQLLGRSSSLAVAGATLAVAAAFQPARHRVQQAVDRRFNRRRYDAAQTIERFSARLRQQVDLDTLTSELLAVVDQTMQPTQASLWLRPSVPASHDQRRMDASRAASQPATASPSAPMAL